ncbi:hypothetical protein M2360_000024 [Rhizobium sp. SG_E_25_P2]|uniref:DUF4304 domain-containing protein n=1 Tax=Rhizobium sp. SG_E_25_P2 TaxID=2879942 RepID=UPI0024752372|nr:DUF4304 domain-containing protein [Rhizobium sp. SG_E_25_P2]MDH6264643.1 hypothetical protein [Rhizobium sp. SG_E_25_P2]
MSVEVSIVIDALTETALANGFKPVGSVYFYKAHPEITCVVNLQKSQWGPQHYINAGVSFFRLSPTRRPKVSGLHILWRADSVIQDNSPLSNALDSEASLTDVSRRQIIRDQTYTHAFAHLAKCTTEATSLALAHDIGAAVKRLAKPTKETGNALSH